MGNAMDNRSQFEGGNLYVKTDKTFYYKGDTVYGKIYIRCSRPMQANFLELDIKAKEKASHWDWVTRMDDFGNEVTEQVKVRFGEKFFEFKQNCFKFNEPLAPGDYTIPFEFKLPTWAPGSCYW